MFSCVMIAGAYGSTSWWRAIVDVAALIVVSGAIAAVAVIVFMLAFHKNELVADWKRWRGNKNVR